MKNQIFLTFVLVLAIPVFGYGQSNSWRNLKPLQSTRQDVENLLGKPKASRYSDEGIYEFENETVSFSYIEKRCEAGWNVAPDTVYRISITEKSNAGKSFEEINLVEAEYRIITTDVLSQRWINAEKGIRYYFANAGRNLVSKTYTPKSSDNQFRCDGYPSYAPDREYFTMDYSSFYYSTENKEDSLGILFARTDGFTINVLNDKERSRGYVVVYFDNQHPFSEYKQRLIKLSNYIYKQRKMTKEQIAIIEGGLRKESLIEFYIIPKEWKPPVPDPDFPSPQFMRKQQRASASK